jgi:AcrR family transcriptional regulator
MPVPGTPTGRADAPERPADPTLPTTERGRRMRARLLVAAREVFERDGFLAARVTDISAAAGVAHGSFYTYFKSKADVFRALVAATMDELYASLGGGGAGGDHRRHSSPADAVARIDRANRRFVAMYRQNTALMALFEQVTTFDPEVRALRQAARERMVDRVRHSIEQLQADGLADADLDAEYSAHALVAMVNGLVHYWLVLGADFEEERLVRTMTGLWASSLGLPAEG